MFKMSVILNLSVSTEQPKCSDERKCKYQEIKLIITRTIVLITGHFSNSTELLKFHSKEQIPQLSSKFRGPLKTVGPTNVYMSSPYVPHRCLTQVQKKTKRKQYCKHSLYNTI